MRFYDISRPKTRESFKIFFKKPPFFMHDTLRDVQTEFTGPRNGVKTDSFSYKWFKLIPNSQNTFFFFVHDLDERTKIDSGTRVFAKSLLNVFH